MAGRTWIAVVLCFFVWFAYIKWFAPPVPNQPSTQSQGETLKTDQPVKDIINLSKAPSLKADLTATTKNTIVAFSTKGGKPSEITLKGFHQTVKDDSPLITTLDATRMAQSLATIFTSPALEDLSWGEYRVEEQGPDRYTFSRTAPSGAKLTKYYELGEGYVSKLRFVLRLPEKLADSDLGAMLIPLGGAHLQYDASEPMSTWEIVVNQDDSISRTHLSDIEDKEVRQGNTNWVAFGNRYFADALVNQSTINPDVEMTSGEAFKGAYMKFPLRVRKGESELSFNYTLYSGPKDVKEVDAVPGLQELIDFGMFSVVAYPLLRVLKFFYGFVHNYGVAIILLTILVRVLFYPLTAKSMKSMKAMQKLQPHIAALKEKYKDDRDRLNREQMALFKTHKVNPAAGCLPMLVQLPVFLALYQVLANSMELFHAPFFGWVQDLSAKDPYYIYPILMGIAMFAQQKMTPAVGMDPAQQKMMLLMPIVFTFLMVSLPSGLTLYIFVSTLLGILQQVLTSRTKEPALAAAKSEQKI